jgi:hypothetical protein
MSAQKHKIDRVNDLSVLKHSNTMTITAVLAIKLRWQIKTSL